MPLVQAVYMTLIFPRIERKLYYKKRDDARRNGKKYLSIIIDGMDQSKTNLPNFTGDKAKVCLIGLHLSYYFYA